MEHIQAINALYNAARMAPLNAPDHELVKRCAEQLVEAIKAQFKAQSQEDGKVVPLDDKTA